MKKAISIFISALLVLSLAACSGNSGGADSAPESPATPADSSAPANAAPEGAETVPAETTGYEETYTYSWCTPGSSPDVDYNNPDDALASHFTDKFNISWDKVDTTFDNHLERVRVWINSGDMPDMVSEWTLNFSELKSYADQGLIAKLPDNWKERWPNLAAAYNRTGVGDELDTRVGGTYILPHPIFAENQPIDPLLWHYAAFFRKDWLETMGVELKDSYTINEVIEIARMMKEQDPGGVGPSLKPINAHTSFMVYFFPYSVYGQSWNDGIFFRDTDGGIKWGPGQPEMLEGLKIFQDAYREGLLNPEFYTLNANEGQEDFFTTGNTGIVIECGMAYFMNYFQTNFKSNMNLEYDDVCHEAVITGNDGKYHSAELANYSGGVLFSPELAEDEDRFNRLLDLLDYTTTEEGQYILRIGFEGEDYTVDGSGNYTIITPVIREKYPSLTRAWSNICVLSDDFGVVNPAYPEKFRNRMVELYKIKESLSDETTVSPADWDIRFFSSPSRDRVTYNYPEEYANLILKEGDLEANWNAWVDEAMSTYIQPVLDEMNAQLN